MSADDEHDYHERLAATVARLADTQTAGETHPIRGVAIGEGDITTGLSGERTVWTPDVMREAADAGRLGSAKVIRGRAGDGHHELGEQAAPADIVGRVALDYEPGVGLVFEGSLLDEHLASLVANDLIDVSPDLYRELGEPSDDPTHDGARRVSEIRAVPRVTLVDEGAVPSNDIQRVETEALAALSYEELSEKCTVSSVPTPSEEYQEQASHAPEYEKRQTTDKARERPRSHMASNADQLDERLAALREERDELKATNEQLREENQLLKRPYLETLTEGTDLTAEDVNLNAEGLAARFGIGGEDEPASAERLTTEPLTGAVETHESDENGTERLSRDEEERLSALKEQRRLFSGRPGMDERVEELDAEIEALAEKGGDA